MKAFLLGAAADLATTALLLTFYLPVMKDFFSSEAITLDRPGFVRLWRYEGQPINPLGLAGEVFAGLVAGAAVYLARTPGRRSPARWQ